MFHIYCKRLNNPINTVDTSPSKTIKILSLNILQDLLINQKVKSFSKIYFTLKIIQIELSRLFIVLFLFSLQSSQWGVVLYSYESNLTDSMLLTYYWRRRLVITWAELFIKSCLNPGILYSLSRNEYAFFKMISKCRTKNYKSWL